MIIHKLTVTFTQNGCLILGGTSPGTKFLSITDLCISTHAKSEVNENIIYSCECEPF